MKFGTRRTDIYFRAAEDIGANRLVRKVNRPQWGVKLVRTNKQAIAFTGGVTCDAALKGEGVWVRVDGPADIAVV